MACMALQTGLATKFGAEDDFRQKVAGLLWEQRGVRKPAPKCRSPVTLRECSAFRCYVSHVYCAPAFTRFGTRPGSQAATIRIAHYHGRHTIPGKPADYVF